MTGCRACGKEKPPTSADFCEDADSGGEIAPSSWVTNPRARTFAPWWDWRIPTIPRAVVLSTCMEIKFNRCNLLGNNKLHKLDTEKALEALAHVQCVEASYTEWLNAGAALKSAGCSWTDWDSWSRADPARYHEGECQRKWGSLPTQISVVTLIDMAKARGYVPSWA